jgi:two-component system sensor histidine kinase YesM
LNNLLVREYNSQGSSGVGVKNVHERIQLYYGKEYGLQIESELEEGTNVKIWLPIVKDENPEDIKNEKRNKTV